VYEVLLNASYTCDFVHLTPTCWVHTQTSTFCPLLLRITEL